MYICNRLRCNLYVLVWAKVKIYLKDTGRAELYEVCSDANAILRLWERTRGAFTFVGKDHGSLHFRCPSSLPTVWVVFGASRRTISPLVLGSQSQGPMGRWKLELSQPSLWSKPPRT